jgi:hypothetical protein
MPKPMVSAYRVKKEGVCFEGALASKNLVPRLSLTVQSMYLQYTVVPLPSLHLHPQGAYQNQDYINHFLPNLNQHIAKTLPSVSYLTQSVLLELIPTFKSQFYAVLKVV